MLIGHAQCPRPLAVAVVHDNSGRARAVEASDDRLGLASIFGDSLAIDAEASGDIHERKPRIEVDDAGGALVGARALAELARDVDVVFEMPADVPTRLGAHGVTGARGQQDKDERSRSHGHTMSPATMDRNRARVFR
jgi:hypothetical protein